MDWVALLVSALFAFAWLNTLYHAHTDHWTISRTAGWLIFLTGATIGAYYNTLLPTNSALRPWIEPLAATLLLIGIATAWLCTPPQRHPLRRITLTGPHSPHRLLSIAVLNCEFEAGVTRLLKPPLSVVVALAQSTSLYEDTASQQGKLSTPRYTLAIASGTSNPPQITSS